MRYQTTYLTNYMLILRPSLWHRNLRISNRIKDSQVDIRSFRCIEKWFGSIFSSRQRERIDFLELSTLINCLRLFQCSLVLRLMYYLQ